MTKMLSKILDRRKMLAGLAAGAGASTLAAPAIAQVRDGMAHGHRLAEGPARSRHLRRRPKLAARITEMSDGKLSVKVFAAGELVPGSQTFEAVQNGVPPRWRMTRRAFISARTGPSATSFRCRSA